MLDRMLAIVGQRGDLPKATICEPTWPGSEASCCSGLAPPAPTGWRTTSAGPWSRRRPGHWDWSLYQENAREIRKAGLKYVPYIWVQNLPSWVRHGADYRFATCLEHGKPSESLSVFSPKTVEAYDRVFAQLKAALGTQIDALRIGSPCDYGETHYPAGAASQAFPVAHMHMGWWAGEPEAQAALSPMGGKEVWPHRPAECGVGDAIHRFRVRLSARSRPRRGAGSISSSGITRPSSSGSACYSTSPANTSPRPRSASTWAGRSRRSSWARTYRDWSRCSPPREMIVRTPTGPMVTHLYTRRVTTAARFYHVPRLSTEPVRRFRAGRGDRGSPVQGPHDRRHMALRLPGEHGAGARVVPACAIVAASRLSPHRRRHLLLDDRTPAG